MQWNSPTAIDGVKGDRFSLQRIARGILCLPELLNILSGSASMGKTNKGRGVRIPAEYSGLLENNPALAAQIRKIYAEFPEYRGKPRRVLTTPPTPGSRRYPYLKK